MKIVALCIAVLLSVVATAAAADPPPPPGAYNCTFTDPVTGNDYDVSGLMNNNKDYQIMNKISATTYTYFINPCRQVLTDICGTNVACCEYFPSQFVQNNKFSLGSTTSARAEAGTTDEQKANGGFTIFFTGGTPMATSTQARQFQLNFICDPTGEDSVGTPELVGRSDPNQHEYTIKWTTTHACPVASGLSGGSIILIILVVVVFVYFVGGMIFMKFVKHAEGIEIIPNVEFWASIPGLVKDGALFIGSKTCCRNPNQSGFQQL